jgi:hypothetical protein
MAEFKNNHYVPEMLLKRFMSEGGELFYYDKRNPNKPIEHRNPSSVFCEKNLYVQVDKQKNRDTSLEKDIFSRLDNDSNLVIEKIVRASRNSELPKLSVEEKSKLDEFLFQQWRRTPDFEKTILTPTHIDNAFERTVSSFEETFGSLTPEKLAEIKSNPTRSRIVKGAKILALKKSNGDAMDALSKRGLGIVKITDAKKSFIIGSFPVVKCAFPDSPYLSDLSVEVWMPISHDVAITPWGIRGQEKLVGITSEDVRILNKMIFKQSSEIAGRAKALISSIAQLK